LETKRSWNFLFMIPRAKEAEFHEERHVHRSATIGAEAKQKQLSVDGGMSA
jgi:hypothetical protein